MYNEDGSEATYSDGSPKTMDLSEFKSLISQNVADTENVYSNAMNELSTSAENLGATYGGEYNKYFSSKNYVSRILEFLKNWILEILEFLNS